MTRPSYFYGLLTVKLENPPKTEAGIMAELKKALGISAPILDEELGLLHRALPRHLRKTENPNESLFVVGVEHRKLAELTQGKHPNVVGCLHAMGYSDTGKPLHLKAPPMPGYKKPKGPGF